VLVECSIQTAKGVKVADVAWMSDGFVASHGFETPYSAAPELCVEVRSPSDAAGEIAEKTALYLAAGAREVWICHETGEVEFFSRKGRVASSELFPGFPDRV
jgi:Uma2 family endonuclease